MDLGIRHEVSATLDVNVTCDHTSPQELSTKSPVYCLSEEFMLCGVVIRKVRLHRKNMIIQNTKSFLYLFT